MFGGTGVFGNNNQNNTQGGGGLFGGQSNTVGQGNSIFGGQNQVQPQGVFGQQGQGGFGMQSQGQQPQGQGMFGGAQGGQGGGIFGGGQNQSQAQGGLFGASNNNNAFGQAKTPGQGLFGSNPQPQQSVFGQPQQSAFGQTQQTQQGNGLFGNTGSTGTGVFGATTNAGFGQQPQQQNVFGQQSQPQNSFGQQGGNNVFGQTSTFGQNQNQNQGGIFGQANSAFNKPANTFGNTAQGFGGQQQQTGLFGQQQQQPQQGGGLFGAPQQQGAFGSTTGSVFGQNQQTGFGGNVSAFGNNTGGGLFGAAQQQPQQGTSVFGGTQNQTTSTFGQPQQTGFNFGNQPTTTAFGGAQNQASTQNSFGNTAWGVPTPAQNNQQLSKFVPLKPKNPKIDSKHVVKCITLLDENISFCKKELQARFILSGGVPQPLQQGIGQQSSFGGSAFGNTNTSGFGGGIVAGQAPGQGQSAFGFSSNNNAGGSLFGTNNQATGAFGQTQQASTFGQQTSTPQTGGLFGATSSTPAFGQAQPASGGLFGNSANNSFKPATTGGSSLFGNSATTPAFGTSGGTGFGTGTAFGTGATSTPGTAFGSGGNGFSFANTQPAGGLFGASTPAAGTGGMFGNSAGGSAFGTTTAGNPSFGAPSAFTTTPSTFGQTGSLFGQAQPQTSFMGSTQTQPQSSIFGGGTSSFGQTPQATSSFNNFGNQQGSELTTLLLNGLFNTDFFKQMMGSGNATPFENLVKQIQNTSTDKKFNSFPKTSEESYDGDYGNYLPKWNKYNQNMYSSQINSYNDPYLYTDNDDIDYDRISNRGHESFRNEGFQAKVSTNKRSVITNDRITDKNPNKKEDVQRERILPMWHNEAQISRISNMVPLQKQSVASNVLPKLGEYEISPSLKQIQQMSLKQLSHVANVQISNKFGQITFLEPISLLNKDISACVEISQDSIDLCDPEWEGKQKELVFNNFGNYANLKGEEEKMKMGRKIKKWVNKNGMVEVGFDEETGDLTVRI